MSNGKSTGPTRPAGATRNGGKAASGRGALAVPAGRGEAVRVHTARQRKLSSTLWLQRQLNDPYVLEAKRRGLRSRAAFKLMQLDDKYRFLKGGGRVVDLGCAPGGWCQVAAERVGRAGHVVGIDYLATDPVAGAEIIQLDFLDPSAPDQLKRLLDGLADVVLSDMAAPTTGHAPTDHIRVVALAETAYQFAAEVLAPGGVFIAKVFQGGTERSLLDRLKHDFATVRHAKPAASRQDSAEIYVVATGFRAGLSARSA